MSETTTATNETMTRTDTTAILEVENLKKRFGGVKALDGVDLEVKKGEIVGIVGPNGAGKSTLFKSIMNDLNVDSGQVTLNGSSITGLPTAKIVQRGLGRTYQQSRVFSDLTVRENLIVNQPHDQERMFLTPAKGTSETVMERIDELIEFFGLDHLADKPAGDLSTGQKKLLNLAGALLPEPDIMMLDEPTAGVNPNLVEEIIESINVLNEEGTTFCIVEHDMKVVRKLADHVYVLENGTNLERGAPERVLENDRVLEAYFGE